MKIFFLNTHSVLNSGDAGIVLAQIQFFKKMFPSLKISISSRTSETDEKLYKPMGIKVFPPIIPAPSTFPGAVPKIAQSMKIFFSFKSKINLLQEIKKSDLVISSGGGHFYSNRKVFPGPLFFQNLLHVRLASIIKKSLIFFPQSFGPFKNSIASKFLKNILQSENIIKIFAREGTSFDLLLTLLDKDENKNKLDLCPDIAFCLNKEDNQYDSPINLNLPNQLLQLP